MKTMAMALLFTLLPVHLKAEAPDRFITKCRLSSGETIVVAEGDYEARSIGSFSVRIYEPADGADETTFFITGAIHPRDGSVERVICEDVNNDTHPEIIIVARSAGTGNYLSAYAFKYSDNRLIFLAAEEGMRPDSNVIDIFREEAGDAPNK